MFCEKAKYLSFTNVLRYAVDRLLSIYFRPPKDTGKINVVPIRLYYQDNGTRVGRLFHWTRGDFSIYF